MTRADHLQEQLDSLRAAAKAVIDEFIQTPADAKNIYAKYLALCNLAKEIKREPLPLPLL